MQIQGRFPSARYVSRYMSDSMSSLLLSSISTQVGQLTIVEEAVDTRKDDVSSERNIDSERNVTSIGLFVFSCDSEVY